MGRRRPCDEASLESATLTYVKNSLFTVKNNSNAQSTMIFFLNVGLPVSTIKSTSVLRLFGYSTTNTICGKVSEPTKQLAHILFARDGVGHGVAQQMTAGFLIKTDLEVCSLRTKFS